MNDDWATHIRSAVVGVVSMCIINIGIVIWWAAKLDSISTTAVTRAELALRDERIKHNTDAIKERKEEQTRADDKLDRIHRLISSTP